MKIFLINSIKQVCCRLQVKLTCRVGEKGCRGQQHRIVAGRGRCRQGHGSRVELCSAARCRALTHQLSVHNCHFGVSISKGKRETLSLHHDNKDSSIPQCFVISILPSAPLSDLIRSPIINHRLSGEITRQFNNILFQRIQFDGFNHLLYQ
jgi:hypothetical protein